MNGAKNIKEVTVYNPRKESKEIVRTLVALSEKYPDKKLVELHDQVTRLIEYFLQSEKGDAV